ncbi:MAG TPA: glycosyltransferase family 2 protein [Terriglobia bacterium]|nr:glycosyltransferase family 2 protein [Terriglobia bacterium]
MPELSQSSAPGSEAASIPMVSIVIPVRNEASNLGALFADLLKQDYPPGRFEILVADGESTDWTREVVEDFARTSPVRTLCLPNPRRLSSAGRNVGIIASRGEFIIFIDGHCRLPDPAYLRHTVRLFQDTGADCLCRPAKLETHGNTWFQNVVAHARSTFLGHGPDSTIYVNNFEGFVNPTSAGAFYRRSVFDKVGLHDEGFDACEDVEINHRVHAAGLRSYLSSSLAVTYRPRKTPFGVFSQLFRYGRGRFRFVRKHYDAMGLGQLIPAAFVAWLLLGAIGSFFSTPAAMLYLASLAAYGLVVLWYSIGLGFRYGLREVVCAPLVYFLMHLGLGAGFWLEAARSLWAKPAASPTPHPMQSTIEGTVRRSTGGEE